MPLLALFVCVAIAGFACAADDLKGKMSKEQKDAIEKIAAIAKLRQESEAESDPKKKQTKRATYQEQRYYFNAAMRTALRADGAKDWVDECGAVTDKSRPLRIEGIDFAKINFEGMREELSKVLRDLKPGDPIRFTLKPSSKSSALGDDLILDGAGITSIERLKD